MPHEINQTRTNIINRITMRMYVYHSKTIFNMQNSMQSTILRNSCYFCVFFAFFLSFVLLSSHFIQMLNAVINVTDLISSISFWWRKWTSFEIGYIFFLLFSNDMEKGFLFIHSVFDLKCYLTNNTDENC